MQMEMFVFHQMVHSTLNAILKRPHLNAILGLYVLQLAHIQDIVYMEKAENVQMIKIAPICYFVRLMAHVDAM